MQARRACCGRSPTGPSHHRSASVHPEGANRDDPWARVQFAANGYMCAEVQGKMPMRVLCERCVVRLHLVAHVHTCTNHVVACLLRHALGGNGHAHVYMAHAALHIVLGSMRHEKLMCRLPGHEKQAIKVRYATRDGTAIGSDTSDTRVDYQSQTGVLTFEPGVDKQDIVIPIMQDDDAEANEEFFVDLFKVAGCPIDIQKETVRS